MEQSPDQQDHSLRAKAESSSGAEGANVENKRASNHEKKKKKPSTPPWHSRLFNSLTETVGASLELLGDGELRKRAVPYVLSNTHVQRGISSAAAFGRQIQVVMNQMEQMSLEKYHQWQLNEHRRQLVDVHVGRLFLMDVPQEVRTRLWFLLLQNPALREPLKSLRDLAKWGEGAVSTADVAADQCTDLASKAHGSVASAEEGVEGGAGGEEDEDEDAVLQMLEDRRAGGAGASTSGGAGASARQQQGKQGSKAKGVGASTSGSNKAGPATSPQHFQEEGSGSDHSFSSGVFRRSRSKNMHRADSRLGGGSAKGGNARGGFDGDSYNYGDDGSGSDEREDWEMVDTEGLGYGRSPCRAQEAQAANHRHLFKLLQRRVEAMDGAYDDYRDDHAARAALHADLHALVDALMGVPWTPEQGLSEPCSPESPLALLNDLPSCAEQQEIDEIIMRDINRTFPEHPFFGSAGGQTSLFRLLKAYSLQDVEAGYCQGMAFAAGVLLMYLPEEPAFRLYGRLMGPNGPNMRRLYLPGLDALKVELACFDWLLVAKQPDLQQHLHALCVPPVLYVSQWLMTVFAMPFPPNFSACIIDIMLQEGSDAILLRMSYAILDRLRPQLMALDNFEAVLTTIKVTPLQWGLQERREVLAQALNSPISDDDLQAARASTCTMLASAIKQMRGVDISLKGLAVEDVDAAKADPEVGLAQQQVAGSGGAPPDADAAPSIAAAAPSAAAAAAAPCGAAGQCQSEDVADQSPSEGSADRSPPEGETAHAASGTQGARGASSTSSGASQAHCVSDTQVARAASGTQGGQSASTSECPGSTPGQVQPQGEEQPSQQHGGQQLQSPQQPENGSISQQEQQRQQQWPEASKQEDRQLEQCTKHESLGVDGQGRECEPVGVDDQRGEQLQQSDESAGSLPLNLYSRAEAVLPKEEAQEVLRGLQVEDGLLKMMLSGHRS